MYEFINRRKQETIGHPLWYILGKKRVSGDIGIEIEAEGARFEKDKTRLAPFWEYHIDHSLRGEDNAEYVLKKPIKFEEVPEALDTLWEIFRKNETRLDESNRTSVHVHLNCQNFHINRLASFAAIWFTIEEVLVEWCGDHRVGNLFCLRGKDAPGILTSLKSFILNDGKGMLPDNLHYSNFNIQSLAKFGSIEIRSMRGVPDKESIQTWVNLLERIYKLSEKYPDPRDFVSDFSAYGPSDFFFHILGYDTGAKILSDINWSVDQMKESVYNGIRLAQDIAYCRAWDHFTAKDIEIDVFGRVKKEQGVPQQSPAPLTYTSLASATMHAQMQFIDYIGTLGTGIEPSPTTQAIPSAPVEESWNGTPLSELSNEEWDEFEEHMNSLIDTSTEDTPPEGDGTW